MKSLQLHFFLLFLGHSPEFLPLVESQFLVEKNGSLILKQVDKSYEGVYKCTVSNGIGDELVKSIILNVIGMLMEIFAM